MGLGSQNPPKLSSLQTINKADQYLRHSLKPLLFLEENYIYNSSNRLPIHTKKPSKKIIFSLYSCLIHCIILVDGIPVQGTDLNLNSMFVRYYIHSTKKFTGSLEDEILLNLTSH